MNEIMNLDDRLLIFLDHLKESGSDQYYKAELTYGYVDSQLINSLIKVSRGEVRIQSQ